MIFGNRIAQSQIYTLFEIGAFKSVVLNGRSHLGKFNYIKEKLEEFIQPSDLLVVDHTISGAREARDFVNEEPLFSPYKVVIFDGADHLTEPSQDALLKTLEETPKNAKLFFITEDYDRLLPAFKSRLSYIIQWSRLTNKELTEYLEANTLSEDKDVREFCDGRPPFYLELLQNSSYFKLRDSIRNLMDDKIDFITPDIVKNLKSGPSLERELISHICRQTVRFYLSSKKRRARKFIQFAAILLNQSAANADVYWQKTLLNV